MHERIQKKFHAVLCERFRSASCAEARCDTINIPGMIRLFLHNAAALSRSFRQAPAAAFSRKLPEAPPLPEGDIFETFARGDGPGGRAVAATANCVRLVHLPTGLHTRCHATRSLEENRRLARRALARQVDAALAANGGKASARELAVKRLVSSMARSHSRSSRRHAKIRQEKIATAAAAEAGGLHIHVALPPAR